MKWLPVGLHEYTVFKVDMISVQCFDHHMAPQLYGHVNASYVFLHKFFLEELIFKTKFHHHAPL